MTIVMFTKHEGGTDPRTSRPVELYTGVYVLVVLTAGAYLPSPLYPGYQAAFGVDDLFMTLTYATFALASVPALLFLGPASDALGPKAVLRWGLVAAAIGSACFVFASGPGWLLAGRAAQGIALGAATGAAVALISTRGQGRGGRRAAMTSGLAFVGGTALGPITAGLLAQYLPAPQTLPFLIHLALLGGLWLRVRALEGRIGPVARRWRPTCPRVPTALWPLFHGAAWSGFLSWTVVGLFLSVLPSLLSRSGQTDLAVIGAVLGTVLLCSLLAQPAVHVLGLRNAQLAGLLALLLSLGLLTLSFEGSAATAMTAAVMAGTGHGLAYGGAAAAVEGAVSTQERGSVTGALYIAFYLGAGVPPIIIGLMSLSGSLAAATGLVAAAVFLAVPLAAIAVFSAHEESLPIAP